jgi:hypothetical protein
MSYRVRIHKADCLTQTWSLATSEDCTCGAEPQEMSDKTDYDVIQHMTGQAYEDPE